MKNAFKAEVIDSRWTLEEGPTLGGYLGAEKWFLSICQNGKVLSLPTQIDTCCYFSNNGKIIPSPSTELLPYIQSLSLHQLLGYGLTNSKEMTLPAQMRLTNLNGEIGISNGQYSYAISEIVAPILKQIKEYTSSYCGLDLDRIALSIPQNYTDVQKSILREAGHKAALEIQFYPRLTSLAEGFEYGKVDDKTQITAICIFEEQSFICALVEEDDQQNRRITAFRDTYLEKGSQIVSQIMNYWVAINNIAPEQVLDNRSLQQQLKAVAWKVVRQIQEEHAFKEILQQQYNCQISIERFQIFLQVLSPQITQCLESMMHQASKPLVKSLIVGGPFAHLRCLQEIPEKCLSQTAIQPRNFQQLYATGAAVMASG